MTDLTKADRDGDRVSQPLRSFSRSLAGHTEIAAEEMVETTFPPLEEVPGELVSAYITEKGEVEPARVWKIALSESEGGVA